MENLNAENVTRPPYDLELMDKAALAVFPITLQMCRAPAIAGVNQQSINLDIGLATAKAYEMAAMFMHSRAEVLLRLQAKLAMAEIHKVTE